MSASHQFDEMNSHPTSRPTTNQINNQQKTQKKHLFVMKFTPNYPMILSILGIKKSNLAPPYRKRGKSLHENPCPTVQPLPGRSAPVGPEVFIKRSVIEVSTKPGVKEQLWMPRSAMFR